jgi:hypothetical protein
MEGNFDDNLHRMEADVGHKLHDIELGVVHKLHEVGHHIHEVEHSIAEKFHHHHHKKPTSPTAKGKAEAEAADEHTAKLQAALVEALKSNAKILSELKRKEEQHSQAMARTAQEHQYEVATLTQEHKAAMSFKHTDMLNLEEDVAEHKALAEEHATALRAKEREHSIESGTSEALSHAEKAKLLTSAARWHTEALNHEEDAALYRGGIVKMTAHRIMNLFIRHSRELAAKAFDSWCCATLPAAVSQRVIRVIDAPTIPTRIVTADAGSANAFVQRVAKVVERAVYRRSIPRVFLRWHRQTSNARMAQSQKAISKRMIPRVVFRLESKKLARAFYSWRMMHR